MAERQDLDGNPDLDPPCPGATITKVARIRYQDFERAVKPVVGEFCLHEREKLVSE